MKAVALLPGRSGSFLLGISRDQGAVHVQEQPPGQGLAGDLQPREPARRLDLLPYVSAGPCPGLRDPGQRPVIGQVQGSADGGIARRRPEHRRELAEHLDVGHRGGAHRDRDRRRCQYRPPAELRGHPSLRQCRVEPGGQAALVGKLAQQDPAAVTDQAIPASRDLQGMIPGRILHREERSGLEITGVVTA